MKLHCYMRTLSQQRAGGRCSSADQRAVLVALQGMVSYMHTLVRARTSAAALRFGVDCQCCASVSEVRWLGLVACYRVLRRKQAAYARTLADIRRQLELPCYAGFLQRLWPAVSNLRNSTHWRPCALASWRTSVAPRAGVSAWGAGLPACASEPVRGPVHAVP
eukprot:355589-Chlamydomonas_euryale.AAC.12